MKKWLIMMLLFSSLTIFGQTTYQIDSQETTNLENNSVVYSTLSLYIHNINGKYWFSNDKDPNTKNKYTSEEYFISIDIRNKYLVFVFKNYRIQYNYIN